MSNGNLSVRESIVKLTTEFKSFEGKLLDPENGIITGLKKSTGEIKTSLDNHLVHHQGNKDKLFWKVIDLVFKIGIGVAIFYLTTRKGP